MYPQDAITYSIELNGVITDFFYTGDESTLLGVAMQQSANNSVTTLRCGSDSVAQNYAKDLAFIPLNKECTDSLSLTKTGNDTSFIVVTYVPYLRSEQPQPYNPVQNPATTTDVTVYGSISGGEILIVLFIFLLIVLKLCENIARGLSNVKTGKKFLQYNGGDVEIRPDL